MAKLKLGVIPDEKSVKVVHELPAPLIQNLKLYAEILASETDQPVSDPIKLIGPMLERFMATDREFMKALRSVRSPKSST